MAYFNHAFKKSFLGNSSNPSGNLDTGFLTLAGVASVDLQPTYGVGVFGLFNPATYLSESNVSTALTAGKPLILAASSLYAKDKIGPFHGGYQETTKSKLINPKYISRFYRVDPCTANQDIVHVGQTAYTQSLSPADATCCHDFMCNKTYYLRLDVKGSPVLQYLTRNAYWTAMAYTGCCADDSSPTNTDPTLVMIQWATGLLGQGVVGEPNFIPNVIVGPFISITVTDFLGNVWYQPGTNGGVDEWDQYVSTWDSSTNSCAAGDGAGLTITGAYVDTQFGDCSFQPSDFFQKEPVKIIPQEVDLNGDVCAFGGICIHEECCPRQGTGFGDTVLKDLILSESYSWNFFDKDARIREITQGFDISSAVNRAAFYTHYYILHSVPRFNNPTGVFDNDQYLLDIVTNGTSAAFETAMTTWLTACGCNAELETYSCGDPCPASPLVIS